MLHSTPYSLKLYCMRDILQISFTLFSHLIRKKNGVQTRLANDDQVIVDFSTFDVM